MERLRNLRRDEERSDAVNTAVEAQAAQPAPRVAAETEAQVIYGASVQTLPLVGLRIAQARPLVETILGVAPRSPVLVNGRPVRGSYAIAQGDTLEFVHHAGEKGRRGWTCRSRSLGIRSFAVKML